MGEATGPSEQSISPSTDLGLSLMTVFNVYTSPFHTGQLQLTDPDSGVELGGAAWAWPSMATWLHGWRVALSARGCLSYLIYGWPRGGMVGTREELEALMVIEVIAPPVVEPYQPVMVRRPGSSAIKITNPETESEIEMPLRSDRREHAEDRRRDREPTTSPTRRRRSRSRSRSRSPVGGPHRESRPFF